MPTVIRSALVILSLAGPIFAARAADDKPAEKKPPALTPKELAEGWILLFDGETTFGWKKEGAANAEGGLLSVGGDKDGKITTTTAFGSGLVRWTFRQTGQKKAGMSWRGEDRSPLSASNDGSWVTEEYEPGAAGTSQITLSAPAGTRLDVKTMAFRPTGATPLFSGKDLSGWTVFPGEKYRSKFEVTKEGELHVTNGPGDLQTETKYGDFVLQLECKTNGLALNSGIFFRCIAGQYQNGYEMQIQNAYQTDNRTKPKDFGTGAIYRRVPARKVVSNDNEWFTMTLIARGSHFSTWVNGYQTVDWTDDRKSDENPRKGLRTAPGHLSIQGHDPTTDLLFRNIRIAEMK
ncbi:3-keto-disaccharide hydrolase [Fimbriiglobus ruber]|uniref:Putative secreted glycosyl hydrolase n=1 Tax=Fimbriiglobus ruber TaxID=1908690 RepID=A0A225D3R5_9BACT|nr:DUF1080 domain-containing protein [Fimbriiglobus ruber]OWK36230.1 putative secreted glycosyl hydrolase [Fimbriiglobus ruber]